MSVETDLILDGIALPIGSARGISENLEAIPLSSFRRDINFGGVSFALPGADKFRLDLSASDQHIPAPLMGLEEGDTVTITPAQKLGDEIPTGTTALILRRPPVSGSLTVMDADHSPVTSGFSLSSQTLTFDSATTAPLLAYYRVAFAMMVTEPPKTNYSEWQAGHGWSIGFEEV